MKTYSQAFGLVADTVRDALWEDTTVAANLVYLYRVNTCDSLGIAGEYSTAVEGYASDTTAMDVPLGVAASDGRYTDRVEVTWLPLSGATAYAVYRANSADTVFTLVVDGLSDTVLVDTAVVPGNEYRYRVTAVVGSTEGDPSVPDVGYASVVQIPDAPTGVDAADGADDDTLLVVWGAANNATAYVVYRADSSGSHYVEVAVVRDTLYRDGAVAVNALYFYRVAALSADSILSDLSEADSGHTFFGYVPDGVSASDGESDSVVTVTWDEVDGCVGYAVYQVVSDSTDSLVADSIVGTTYDDSVGPGPCEYRVQAIYANGGRSPLSTQDMGYRLISNREFFVAYNNTTIATSQLKLELLQDKSLGEESAQGEVSGSVHYLADVTWGEAVVDLTYDDYCDGYMTVDGVFTTVVGWISRDGDLTGTTTITGIYPGTIGYHITIEDEDPHGGHYTVTQGGGEPENIQFTSVKSDIGF